MAKKKKTAKKAAKKTAIQTADKQRSSGKFQKGNKIGPRFQKGGPGGPGRPISIASPREQLKKYAEEKAPQKLRDALKKIVPEIDASDLTWAQVIALAHLIKAAQGDMTAIIQMYKQADDGGANTLTGRDGGPIEGNVTVLNADANAALETYAGILAGIARGSAQGATGNVRAQESVDPKVTH